MGKNWAIAIGINCYRNLQPLNYAVRDAEAMRDYFLQDAGFERVYYFSDQSPPIEQDYGPPVDSQPLYTTLKRFLRTRFEQPFLQTGDNLWFFFAGHGMRYEERDYLLPIDGDPGDVEGTAIPISYVTERLRLSGADNVVLLLDACRIQGRRAGQGVGVDVQQGVVTLFSCSPREASYEIDELQQGAFTWALLQGLRLQGEGNCATVERLDQFLRQQVPELNRHYGRPRQTPYAAVEPAAKYHLILLPRQATLRDAETLKLEALKAEAERAYELAEQLWVRVLAVSPADWDAIQAIRRLAQPPAVSESGGRRYTPPAPRPSERSTSRSPSPIPPPRPESLSRRRLIQLAGAAAVGGGSILVVRSQWQSPPAETGSSSPVPTASQPSSPSSTQQPRPAPSSVSGLKPFSFEVVMVNAKGEEANRKSQQAHGFAENLGNGISLAMVAIPGGTFTMGSPDTEAGRGSDEGPQRSVTVPAFLLGKYQVTQAQWRSVAALPKVDRDLTADPSNFKGDNRPVENVSWYDAIEFCQRLSKKTGREYRLPSEAEWEYACRAGTTTPFHFGETITTDLANYNGNDTYGAGPKGVYRQGTTAVGSFKVANGFGLYDMPGNVWEWCLDYWHDNYEGAPTDGSAWTAGGDSRYPLLRGGSWHLNPQYCRSASRTGSVPVSRDSRIGFRVVCSSAWTL